MRRIKHAIWHGLLDQHGALTMPLDLVDMYIRLYVSETKEEKQVPNQYIHLLCNRQYNLIKVVLDQLHNKIEATPHALIWATVQTLHHPVPATAKMMAYMVNYMYVAMREKVKVADWREFMDLRLFSQEQFVQFWHQQQRLTQIGLLDTLTVWPHRGMKVVTTHDKGARPYDLLTGEDAVIERRVMTAEEATRLNTEFAIRDLKYHWEPKLEAMDIG